MLDFDWLKMPFLAADDAAGGDGGQTTDGGDAAGGDEGGDPTANIPAGMTIPNDVLGPDITVNEPQAPDQTQVAIVQLAQQFAQLQNEIRQIRNSSTSTPKTDTQVGGAIDELDPNAPVLKYLEKLSSDMQKQQMMINDMQRVNDAAAMRNYAANQLQSLDAVIDSALKEIPLASKLPDMVRDITNDVRQLFTPEIQRDPMNHRVTQPMVQAEVSRRVAQVQKYIKALAGLNNSNIADQVRVNNATATASGGATPVAQAGKPKPKLSLENDASWDRMTSKWKEIENRLRNQAGV